MIDNYEGEYDFETEDELIPMGRGTSTASVDKVLTFKGSKGLLLVSFQYMENYGDEDFPYWKYKGGDEVIVSNKVFNSEGFFREFVWENEMTKQYLNNVKVLEEDFTFEIPSYALDDEADYINLMCPKCFDGEHITNINFE